jgi:hypothetical protein
MTIAELFFEAAAVYFGAAGGKSFEAHLHLTASGRYNGLAEKITVQQEKVSLCSKKEQPALLQAVPLKK